MGLLTSVNNINYRLEEEKKAKEAERKAKEKERQKAKEEKEAKERIKNDIETILYQDFKEYLLNTDSTHVLEFYNPQKKDELLYKIYSMHSIQKFTHNNKGLPLKYRYIEYKDFITTYFNNNYFKILKRVEEEAKKNDAYKIYAQLTTQEEEYQQEIPTQPTKKEKHIDFTKINKVINIIFTIILIVLFFPIAILIAACKKQK